VGAGGGEAGRVTRLDFIITWKSQTQTF
jgi:hypothetical protein